MMNNVNNNINKYNMGSCMKRLSVTHYQMYMEHGVKNYLDYGTCFG